MISLTKYPVEVNSGVVKNTFPGFDDVELNFKREDIEINSITQGSDNNVLIRVFGDITTDLIVGDWVYIYAPATTVTYDFTSSILDISFVGAETLILLDFQFIELTGGGYMNYKQNYFIESKLVNADNTNIEIVQGSINSDGNAKGEIAVNVNLPVDLLSQKYNLLSGEIEESRIKFKVKVRENYRNNTDLAFSLVEDLTNTLDVAVYPIILIYAVEDCEAETIANEFDEPIFWDGYPNALELIHSDSNAGSERIQVKFSELDINKNVLVPEFVIKIFNLNDYGLLQISTTALPQEYALNANSQYGKLVFETVSVSDYDSSEYDNNEYLTT